MEFRTHEPPSFASSFRANFLYMFKEEWRQNIDFAKRRRIMMFPVMLALVTMVTTIGLRFLTGEAGIGGISEAEQAEKAFSWNELKMALHVSLFMFSLGMGTFAFAGRNALVNRGGGKSFLLGSPALQPLELPPVYLAYYMKEVAFYLCMILTPAVAGMGMGIILAKYTMLTTPLVWQSLPILLLCLLLTMMQGLAFSFLASAIWARWKAGFLVVPLFGAGAAILVGIDVIPLEWAILGLQVQLSHNLTIAPFVMLTSLVIAAVGAHLVPEDFEIVVTTRDDLLRPIYHRLSFLGHGQIRALVSKEMTDVLRSGTLFKMLGSFCVPLLFLLGLAWLADFARFPIPFNLLSYAPFLGFFGFNFYSWLNAVDAPDFLNGLPVSVPKLLQAKIVVYFLMTTWISIIFLFFMAWMLDQWVALLAASIVMIANSVYIVSLSALLMGLRPNKAIFDTQIMGIFWVATSLPLVCLFLLSFTEGDLTLYTNAQQLIAEGGIDANATRIGVQEVTASFTWIFVVSGALFALSGAFLLMLERRWGNAAFEN